MKPDERATSWKNQAWPGAQRPREKKRGPQKKEIRFSQRERRAFSFHPQSKQPPKAVLPLPHITFLTSLKAAGT
jgi:hypothetical protein